MVTKDVKIQNGVFHAWLVMLPFYVQNVGIIAGILNIEDNIHAKCGGVFAILANFITFYYIIPPF